MTQALIAFGANVGDVHESLREAKSRIAADSKIELISVAEPEVTTAVSGKDIQNADDGPAGEVESSGPLADYLNTVFLIETRLSADELFQLTCRIENELGRRREQRWGPRTIDLDIILYGQQIIHQPELHVPHPRMSFRKFVIDPAARIAADVVDPVSGVSIKRLSQRLHQSPRRILWLSDDAPAANSIVDTFAGSDWEFEVAADIRAVGARLKAFRLLVYSGGEVGFLEAAQTFAGPWLSLEGVGSVNSVTEIRGAMEAME